MQGGSFGYVIYSRKSKFTGKGESIENQIELCRQYIRLKDGDKAAINAAVYEDEGFSGGNLDRPQFKKMMSDAKDKNFSAIVVYRLDRISRNISDFAKLIDELNRLKIDFVSIKEQFDTASPMGRAMMYISSVFSQLERETIAERIRDNMRELSKTGRWLGGITPTGYESESISYMSVGGKEKKACKLREIPQEIEIVNMIFEKFIETGSLTKLETYLLQNEYTTKNGNKFTRFALKGILTNPVYMIADDAAYDYLIENNVSLFSNKPEFDGVSGIMAYNRTLQQKGRATKSRGMDEWIVSVGEHKGVINGKTWIKAQKILERNKSKSYKKPRSNAALLSGKLICGSCGAHMRPKISSYRNEKNKAVYSYICLTKEKSCRSLCSIKNAKGNLLDAEIMEQIKKLPEDRDYFVSGLFEEKKELLKKGKLYDIDIKMIEKDIASNESNIKELVSVLGKTAGTLSEEYVINQISELHKKNEGLKARLSEKEEFMSEQRLKDTEFKEICNLLSSFKDILDESTVEQKRYAVQSLIKQVVWDGQEAVVMLFGAEARGEKTCLLKGEKA